MSRRLPSAATVWPAAARELTPAASWACSPRARQIGQAIARPGGASTGWDWSVSEDVDGRVLSVLEALQNVSKYARAEQVEVRITDDGGAICFEVQDDGRSS